MPISYKIISRETKFYSLRKLEMNFVIKKEILQYIYYRRHPLFSSVDSLSWSNRLQSFPTADTVACQ